MKNYGRCVSVMNVSSKGPKSNLQLEMVGSSVVTYKSGQLSCRESIRFFGKKGRGNIWLATECQYRKQFHRLGSEGVTPFGVYCCVYLSHWQLPGLFSWLSLRHLSSLTRLCLQTHNQIRIEAMVTIAKKLTARFS
jgi:hypothetical protein